MSVVENKPASEKRVQTAGLGIEKYNLLLYTDKIKAPNPILRNVFGAFLYSSVGKKRVIRPAYSVPMAFQPEKKHS